MKTGLIRAVILGCLIVGFGIANLAAATQVVLSNIKGKVEVKLPDNSAWAPATEGMVISLQTTVSTGFDSTVTVVMDKNTLVVKPLTRLSVDRLVETQGKISTSCYLRVGGVSASVKSAEGVKQDFKVKSPYSTASVRGTGFDFDGLHLKVDHGLVAFIPGPTQRDLDASPEAAIAAVESEAAAPVPAVGVLVGANGNAEFRPSPSGQGTMTSSDSRDYLETQAQVTVSDSGSSGNSQPVIVGKAATTGSVKVTWE